MLRSVVIASMGILAAVPQLATAPFTPRMFNPNGHPMPYRLFIPDEKARAKPLPLVIWLHGASGVGTDNKAQISSGGNEIGSRLWVKPEVQAKYPAFVLAPQSPSAEVWGAPSSTKVTRYAQLVFDLIDSLSREFSIDRDRVYLLGQSRGGIGVWDMIMKRPDLFAAAVPLCAMGDPKRIGAARSVSVWAFHGAKDPGMPVDGTRALVAALKTAGGVVKYTEYPDVGHDVWTRAFLESDLVDWLFAQRRHPSDCTGACDGFR